MFFTGSVVEDVTCIPVLETTDGVTLKFDGVENFGRFTFEADFFHARFGVYNEGSVATLI